MKKVDFKSAAIGAAGMALALSLSVTAFAANRSISVMDGIRVLVNGQAFQPLDGSGAPVELFSYNGTVYAPVRAICEEAGLTVSYDRDTQTVHITKPEPSGGALQTAPAADSSAQTASGADRNGAALIGEEKAKQIAFDHTGVKAADAVVSKFKLTERLNKSVYELEFSVGSIEYEYEINAKTGEIEKAEQETKKGLDQLRSVHITISGAKDIALQKAPGATVTRCRLHDDDGRMIYEVELENGSTEYECDIDASTGEILKWEVDD